jgi:MoaA/NifB/PqqE/SkfB family radical SAM enzyme
MTRRSAAGRSLPRVRFGVVLMRRNIEELEGIVTLAWRLGVEELNFFHMVTYEGLDVGGESLVHHKALSNAYLQRALALADELGLTVVHAPAQFALLGQPGGVSDLARGEGPAPEKRGTPFGCVPYCPFPFSQVSADAGGHVLPCPFAHGEAAYGTVSADTPFERVWLGPRFTELRTRILTGDPPAMCGRCPYLASRHPDVAGFFRPRAAR